MVKTTTKKTKSNKNNQSDKTSKVVKAILGIGIAIIVYLFFLQFINIVFDEPEMDCYKDYDLKYDYEQNLTQEEIEERDRIIDERDMCIEEYNELREIHSKKVFISAVIIGIILVLLIIPLMRMPNIAGGIGASGIALNVYGFAIGWDYSGDLLKLILLFVSAATIIGLAIWLNERKK
jgi:hypothetical protein